MPEANEIRYYDYEDWEGVWEGFNQQDWEGMVGRGFVFAPPPIKVVDEPVKVTPLAKAGMPPPIIVGDAKRCAHARTYGFDNSTEVTLVRASVMNWSASLWAKSKIVLRPAR
jgi:hypothetical protein